MAERLPDSNGLSRRSVPQDSRAKAEPRMDAWLRTHAAFEVPLGQAVHAAGGPDALARDPDAIRRMIHMMRQNLKTMPTPTVPRAFYPAAHRP